MELQRLGNTRINYASPVSCFIYHSYLILVHSYTVKYVHPQEKKFACVNENLHKNVQNFKQSNELLQKGNGANVRICTVAQLPICIAAYLCSSTCAKFLEELPPLRNISKSG
ncbi:hypothetical protein POVWA2_028490 [Plasmodium ovale wallikeri]|uniref:Uncharacterized protein n=1 Tax=Plasmodium ovale wallikeri TaxID=864142 RepID=A0A1A8YWX8_PLAOA|nr:hypothetical protein POVWA1_028630 [Plasmodium ovale wallikeri]SBT36108.1 hypothetical protein POVWA2_028490 [Plasmodium ovale wallikeri]